MFDRTASHAARYSTARFLSGGFASMAATDRVRASCRGCRASARTPRASSRIPKRRRAGRPWRVRPMPCYVEGGGCSNLWAAFGADRWASFIHKKFRIQSEKPSCVSCLTLGFAFETSEANDLCERGCAIRKYFNTFGERATEAFLVPKPSKTNPFSSRG